MRNAQDYDCNTVLTKVNILLIGFRCVFFFSKIKIEIENQEYLRIPNIRTNVTNELILHIH